MGQWLARGPAIEPIYICTLTHMPIIEEARQKGFVARMSEIASTHTPWHRQLWRTGTMRLARDLLDESTNLGLPQSALDDMKSHLTYAMGTDPGTGDRGAAVKSLIRDLKAGATEGNHSWLGLNEHISRMHSKYLLNWADAFEAGKHSSAEDAARRIGSHLLDCGYHKSSLYTWIRALQQSSAETSVPDFLRQAALRINRPENQYTFCVPISTIPKFSITAGDSPGWMDAAETNRWKKAFAPDAEAIRHQGSFLLTIPGYDINTATERARSKIFDLQTKFELGAKKPVRVCARMWSKEKKQAYATQATNRTIEVQAFENQNRIHDLSTPEYIVSALALVQPLRTSPPHIAVMSGWSAIESLLVGVADDRDIVAAERFSVIIAASMVRAELTHLAWVYAKEKSDDTAQAIASCELNADRAKLFQMRASSPEPIAFAAEVDNLAVDRIRPALTDPRGEIDKIRKILRREFTRLYRKRNLIAHAGKTQESTLHSTSETLSPLIGAGIDRVVYVGLQYGLPPIEMSAKVEAKLHYLIPSSSSHAGNVVDIFEFDPGN
jgi:hypothetical protein